MILIVSHSAREATLLAALCEQRSWPCQAFTTLAKFARQAEKCAPRVVVVRQRLADGYSDDVFELGRSFGLLPNMRVIVLVPADCSIRQETRQVALGADCVLRDPLRLEVLLEYLAKYRAKDGTVAPSPNQPSYEFAGVQVFPHELILTKSGRKAKVAPQEIEFLRLLHRSAGKVLPYPLLYSELFSQKFSGDTANCRVLLAKAASSFAKLGVDLRAHIQVIPKSGYLYASTSALRPPPRGRRGTGQNQDQKG